MLILGDVWVSRGPFHNRTTPKDAKNTLDPLGSAAFMKGNPPFTRSPVSLEYKTARLASHGIELRKALGIAKLGPVTLEHFGGALWATLRSNGILGSVRLIDESYRIKVASLRSTGTLVEMTVAGSLGTYHIRANWDETSLCFRHTVRLRPSSPTRMQPLARELVLTDGKHEPLNDGLIFTTQTGPTAGQVFAAAGEAHVFYFQNLTALSAYATYTNAELASSVDVDWPVLGFLIPAGETPLPKGVSVVISDGLLRITAGGDKSEGECAVDFLDGLVQAYRAFAPRVGEWFDWEKTAGRTLKALGNSKLCLRRIGGAAFLNAYVGSNAKPPESMVQAAIRVPLVEYEQWQLKGHPLAGKLAGNLTPFFLKKLRTMARWLPGEEFKTEVPSEEEQMERMDSWYLLHTLMNLGRLAELGKEPEKALFLKSLEYIMHVAKHFDHDWPVFYDRRTLTVFKREVAEGMGGERDAAGLYAHVMLQAWQITADRRYVDEAETAARKLEGLGFAVLYQTNNTMFTAMALCWLWKETGNSRYRDLSLACMGSIFSHLWMWEFHKPGRGWRTYMGLPPLHDAPYIAPYEEGEVFAASRAYLEAMGAECPLSLSELVMEYGKHLLGRARFYLPEELPPAAISEEPKEGRIQRGLPMPLEDLYPSTDLAGQVGQEVYGSALSLILTTRSWHRWPKVPFQVWTDAPLSALEFSISERSEKGKVRLVFRGSDWQRHSFRVMPKPSKRRLTITARASSVRGSKKLTLGRSREGHRVAEVSGGAEVLIEWRLK